LEDLLSSLLKVIFFLLGIIELSLFYLKEDDPEKDGEGDLDTWVPLFLLGESTGEFTLNSRLFFF
jgi:hypothetical protein